MELLDDIVKEFLVESYENLDQLDRDLVALEEAPDDRDCLSRVFRTIHTIKGTSGFLAFTKLQQVTHVGENLLVPLRDGELRLNRSIADSLLAMVDAVRGILRSIESSGAEGEADYSVLIDTLDRLRRGETSPPAIDAEAVVQALAPPPTSDSAIEAGPPPATPKKTRRKPSTSRPAKSGSVKAKPANARRKQSAALCDSPTVEPHDAGPIAPATVSDSVPAAVVIEEPPVRTPTPASTSVASPPTTGTSDSEPQDRNSAVSDSTVRIDVHLLDKLMNLVGELVLTRNQILQFGQASPDPAVAAASQRLNLITTELQEGVMKTRMQPIRNAWNKLPRVVRDLAQMCGKEVQVRMEGADTELDKTILEAIRDPLTHVVRNSVDHGIEPPAERVANGKPSEGTLSLRAFHEGGHVVIEISDDGGGIRVDRVRAKAIEKGLVTADQAAGMNDRELTQLILLPGFSTAAQVSNVSGRGVGMDVVKTNVEKIGGTLDIHSQAGQGTTLRIKIPLTLAIVPALVVKCAEDRYCIPQVSLQELVRLEGERARSEIELLHSVPVYRLRGRLLPMVYLDEELGIRPRRTMAERHADEVVNIVVLQSDERQFGLVVDQITDTQEIVVKPLGRHLSGMNVYAGSTIMGDGAVALILDVLGLAQQAHVLAAPSARALHDAAAARLDQTSNRVSYLVVDPGDGSRAAIPLTSVARLERIRSSAIERSGHRDVVQYRGEIMPLLSLSGFGGLGGATADELSLVVHRGSNGHAGVAVGSIVDIVDHEWESDAARHGDTCILAGRVTQLIDLAELARQAG